MLCDICHKSVATVHLTEIIDEQMAELHLCENCARQKSMEMEQQFGLADLLAGLSSFGEQIEAQGVMKLKCRLCGMSYENFKKMGRLGCSECYESFKPYLKPLLKKIHGSSQHIGKSLAKKAFVSKVSKVKLSQLDVLKNKLQVAIQKEEFEEAAKLRDKIKGLQERGER